MWDEIIYPFPNVNGEIRLETDCRVRDLSLWLVKKGRGWLFFIPEWSPRVSQSGFRQSLQWGRTEWCTKPPQSPSCKRPDWELQQSRCPGVQYKGRKRPCCWCTSRTGSQLEEKPEVPYTRKKQKNIVQKERFFPLTQTAEGCRAEDVWYIFL